MTWANFLLAVGDIILPILWVMLRSNTKLTEFNLKELKELRRNWNDSLTSDHVWMQEITFAVKRNSEAVDKLLLLQETKTNKE